MTCPSCRADLPDGVLVCYCGQEFAEPTESCGRGDDPAAEASERGLPPEEEHRSRVGGVPEWEARLDRSRLAVSSAFLGLMACLCWYSSATGGDWRGLLAGSACGLASALGFVTAVWGRARIRVSRLGIELKSLVRDTVIPWTDFAAAEHRLVGRGREAVAITVRNGRQHVVGSLWVYRTTAQEFLRAVQDLAEQVPKGSEGIPASEQRALWREAAELREASSARVAAVGFALLFAVYLPLRLFWPVVRSAWSAQPRYRLVFVLMLVPSVLVAGCLVGALWQDEEIIGGSPTGKNRGLLAFVAAVKALVLALLLGLVGASGRGTGGGSFGGGGASGRW